MGLFDHLFKTKSSTGEEKSVESTGAGSAKPGESPGSQASSRADPSVFLHPKDFVRPSTIVPAVSSGQTSAARHPERKPAPGRVCTLGEAVTESEKSAIRAALEHTRGRKAEAAQVLGISRKNLWEKMKAYGME